MAPTKENAAVADAEAAMALEFLKKTAPPKIDALIRSKLHKNAPDFGIISSVSSTAVPGIYEVRVERNVFYTDEKADYVFNGHIIDVSKKFDKTQERLEQLNRIDFKKLPLNDALKIVRGDGSKKLVIFEDPNCGYCKKLEADLKEVGNSTIYVFLYPVLGAGSMEKSKKIWCAKDNAQAWEDWILEAKAPADGTCNTAAIDRNLTLGRSIGVNGTPGIFYEDGTRTEGAMPTETIVARMAKAANQ